MLAWTEIDDELRAIAKEWAPDERGQLLLSLVKVRLHNLWRASGQATVRTINRRINQRGAVRELHDDLKHLISILEHDDETNRPTSPTNIEDYRARQQAPDSPPRSRFDR